MMHRYQQQPVQLPEQNGNPQPAQGSKPPLLLLLLLLLLLEPIEVPLGHDVTRPPLELVAIESQS